MSTRNIRQQRRMKAAMVWHPEPDRTPKNEDCEEHDTGWYWPEQDASRTFPGFDKQEKKQ